MPRTSYFYSRFIIQLTLLLFGISGSFISLAQINLLGINLQYPQSNRVQVIITADSRFDYKTFKLGADSKAKKLPRFVLDAFDTQPQFWLGESFQRLFAKDPILQLIRVGKNKVSEERKFTRIVIDLRDKDITSRVDEVVTANGNFQLILQLTNNNIAAEEATQQAQPQQVLRTQPKRNNSPSKTLSVIIDPGHGGRDPGAIAADKQIYEKNITLPISQLLFELLQQDPAFTPQLTRTKDTQLSLNERLKTAHNGADMFISIHADSFPFSDSVRGASVYILSSKKNSDQLSRLLAENQNAVDAKYGLGDINDISDDEAQFIARDLQVQAIANASRNLATAIINSLAQSRPTFNQRINQGPFYVLRSAYTPSVLVEVGFLSNLQEARELATESVQKNIANAIYQGISNYAKNNLATKLNTSAKTSIDSQATRVAPEQPAANTTTNLLDKLSLPSTTPANHTVAKGETFLSIGKRYGISEQNLKKANAKYQGIIFPGDILIIPIN